MHRNRRDHILSLAREKVAALVNTSVASVQKKPLMVEVPEAPKPKAPSKPSMPSADEAPKA